MTDKPCARCNDAPRAPKRAYCNPCARMVNAEYRARVDFNARQRAKYPNADSLAEARRKVEEGLCCVDGCTAKRHKMGAKVSSRCVTHHNEYKRENAERKRLARRPSVVMKPAEPKPEKTTKRDKRKKYICKTGVLSPALQAEKERIISEILKLARKRKKESASA